MVRCQFSLPCVTYLGTNRGCGCGFRSAMFQRGCWPEEWVASEPGYVPEEGSQPNHEALAAFVRGLLAAELFVELYGCWWGDFQEPPQDHQEIVASRLADPGFFFHHRGRYVVRPDS